MKRSYGVLGLQTMQAYLGMKIAMSIVKLNHIMDYWADCMFLIHSHIANVMSLDNSAGIRSCLRFYSKYNNYIVSADPLLHFRIIMKHFYVHFATVALPTGFMSFDETAIRCKRRRSARS